MWAEAHPLMRVGTIVMGAATVVAMAMLFLAMLAGPPDMTWFRWAMFAIWFDVVGFAVLAVGFIVDLSAK